MTFLNAASIAGGVAVVLNGLGVNLWWKNLHMPEPQEKTQNAEPSNQTARWLDIGFGLGLLACGVFGLFHS